MRRALPVGVVSLAGLVLFCWPFFGSGLPANTPAWALTIGCVAGLLLVEAGTRELDSRAVALLAAIAAIDTALRLSVIEGIEVSRLFGCGESNGTPQCDQAQVDAGLNEVRTLGVRTFFPVHEFNNAFGWSKMIAGSQGLIINAWNRLETGSRSIGYFTVTFRRNITRHVSPRPVASAFTAPPTRAPTLILFTGPS